MPKVYINSKIQEIANLIYPPDAPVVSASGRYTPVQTGSKTQRPSPHKTKSAFWADFVLAILDFSGMRGLWNAGK